MSVHSPDRAATLCERIPQLHDKFPRDITDEDLADMLKVVGYVHRHLAQRPHCEVRDTRWRHPLRN